MNYLIKNKLFIALLVVAGMLKAGQNVHPVGWGGSIIRGLKSVNLRTRKAIVGLDNALLQAVNEQDVELVKRILHRGANPNAGNEAGVRALHQAARFGNREIALCLLSAGAGVTFKTRDGDTALALAAFGGHEGVIRSLLQFGGDPNIGGYHVRWLELGEPVEHLTPLILAVISNNERVVKLLLDSGASINTATFKPRFFTALMAAVLRGHEGIVRLLLDKGASLRLYSHTAICEDSLVMRAVKLDYGGVVQLLLDAGADVHDRDRKGCTLLEIAVGMGSESLVQILLNAGADPSLVRNTEGFSYEIGSNRCIPRDTRVDHLLEFRRPIIRKNHQILDQLRKLILQPHLPNYFVSLIGSFLYSAPNVYP